METKFIKANSKLIPRYTCGIYAIKNNLNGRMYIGSSTNIRACCDGRKKSCCGFQWSYTKANRVDEYHVKEYEIKNKRPVVQLDYDGNTIIAQYDSIREASRATGVSRQSISDCLRKNARHKHAGGFTWRRVKIKEGQYDK